VGKNGSIDWLRAAPTRAVPRRSWVLEQRTVVNLLGRFEHGAALPHKARRARDIHTDDGVVSIIDCMPIRGRTSTSSGSLEASRVGSRCMDLRSGSTTVDRPVGRAGRRGILWPSPANDRERRTHGGQATVADFVVEAGEQVLFGRHPSHQPPPTRRAVRDRDWWRHWAKQCTYGVETL
jgi:hypothetical protein